MLWLSIALSCFIATSAAQSRTSARHRLKKTIKEARTSVQLSLQVLKFAAGRSTAKSSVLKEACQRTRVLTGVFEDQLALRSGSALLKNRTRSAIRKDLEAAQAAVDVAGSLVVGLSVGVLKSKQDHYRRQLEKRVEPSPTGSASLVTLCRRRRRVLKPVHKLTFKLLRNGRKLARMRRARRKWTTGHATTRGQGRRIRNRVRDPGQGRRILNRTQHLLRIHTKLQETVDEIVVNTICRTPAKTECNKFTRRLVTGSRLEVLDRLNDFTAALTDLLESVMHPMRSPMVG